MKTHIVKINQIHDAGRGSFLVANTVTIGFDSEGRQIVISPAVRNFDKSITTYSNTKEYRVEL